MDLETTGVDVNLDRIVSACVILLPKSMDGGPRVPKVFQWLANPGIEIPEAATAVHGISTEHARKHGADPAEVADRVAGMLRLAIEREVPIVGMNLRYDNTLLDRECQRHGVPPAAESPAGMRPVIDINIIDKWADPFRKKEPDGTSTRNLAGLCKNWGVRLEGAHDSTVDALASLRVAYKMARGPIPRVPTARPYDTPQVDIGALKPGDLHDAQVEQAAKQAKSMATWFRRLAGQATDPAEREELLRRADDCRPEWPFVPRGVAPATEQGSLW